MAPACGPNAPAYQPDALLPACTPPGRRCTISDCGEEGAVAMDSSRLTLHACTMSGCKGPGVDASGAARVRITGGSVEGCVGGVFLWDSSRALLRGATLAGGPCHALLVDGAAMPDAQVRGSGRLRRAAPVVHAWLVRDPDQAPRIGPRCRAA